MLKILAGPGHRCCWCKHCMTSQPTPFTQPLLHDPPSFGESLVRQQLIRHNFQLSSSQDPGYLLYIRDEILPSYIGIIISHYKDPPYSSIIVECHRGFGRCSISLIFVLHGPDFSIAYDIPVSFPLKWVA